MNSKVTEIKQIASQLLAGMLANPHIYPQISDEGNRGQLEQELILIAMGMAEELIDKAEKRNP